MVRVASGRPAIAAAAAATAASVASPPYRFFFFFFLPTRLHRLRRLVRPPTSVRSAQPQLLRIEACIAASLGAFALFSLRDAARHAMASAAALPQLFSPEPCIAASRQWNAPLRCSLLDVPTNAPHRLRLATTTHSGRRTSITSPALPPRFVQSRRLRRLQTAPTTQSAPHHHPTLTEATAPPSASTPHPRCHTHQ
eukprot:CAMPEP_0196655220 /NCGR_PEP_ID=MMETSP1086-20130531/4973_1 /TAXON_ID=77921 /ORGANISM="Cyanoptyche  gloeocystis , Strain SAG4.97" /LENGTH=195 /DNA_ID=CAMNT_0041987417 /DNA_START=316 /DNA_END=900 /DNA_ORIENTATION=-